MFNETKVFAVYGLEWGYKLHDLFSIVIENAKKRVVPMEQRTLLSSNESLKRAALKSTQNKNTRQKK